MSDVTLSYPGGELPLARGARDRRQRRPRHLGAAEDDRRTSTLDGGFINTASCTSAITYIDGDDGILRYRGYPIEQLAAQSTFLETSYLLIYGELPTRRPSSPTSRQRIKRHTMLHEDLRRFFDGFPRDAHPMPVLSLRGQRAVDLLPGLARPVRPRAGRDLHRSACWPSCRPSRRTPTRSRVGQPLPLPRQLAEPHRELPAHDVRRAGRALRGRPGRREGARPAADPARRPRAELLDVDRAAGRLVARQPVRLGVGRHQRAVRAAARRRQPGGAGDARRRSTAAAAA